MTITMVPFVLPNVLLFDLSNGILSLPGAGRSISRDGIAVSYLFYLFIVSAYLSGAGYKLLAVCICVLSE
jgi:hypothetical protein